MKAIGANVASVSDCVLGMAQTFAVAIIVGAKVVSVRLLVDGITALANLGAKVAVVRLRVVGVVVSASFGANVAVVRAFVDGIK